MSSEPNKSALRAAIRDRLRKKTPGDDATLREKLDELLQRLAPTCCVAYLAFQNEPKLDELLYNLLIANKLLVIPRFCSATRSYELAKVSDLTSQLVIGHYGIREPLPELTVLKRLPPSTVWLVPGLAFSAAGARLGRGAGYYDRLFAQFPQGKRIGVAWDCQLLTEIPQEPWDRPMDYVVTETQVIACHSSSI